MTVPSARWSKTLLRAKASSVRQPFAWLIIHGGKDVENRTRRTSHRGDLLIHAGLSTDILRDAAEMSRLSKKYGVKLPAEYDLGGIIGVAELAECVTEHTSIWRTDSEFGWVLRNPRSLTFRGCKGQLGLFTPSFQMEH